MLTPATLLLSLASLTGLASPPSLDTLHLQVGSPQVDGRVFPAHLARNRAYPDPAEGPVNTWTNELSVGDSAGAPVMRWITRGVRLGPEGTGATWELHQTYDARTLAPLTYFRTGSEGGSLRLRIDGTRVSGVETQPGMPPRPFERTLETPAYFAGASDLVPMAMRMERGMVMTAPVWSPGMPAVQERVFHVLDRVTVTVEGAEVEAWKVEERLRAGGRLLAVWYLTDRSPYMVLGEIPLSDGRLQRITGVDVPTGG